MSEEYIYSCNNHIDMAIDDFILDKETFPLLEASNGEKCGYCENDAEYMLLEIAT